LRNNLDKDISWNAISQNDNDEALDLLLEHPNKINWNYLSGNSNDKAIELLKKNPEKICWCNFILNTNEKIIPILIKNLDKIRWFSLFYKNSNKNIKDIMKKYNENYISYESIFKIDYEKMSKNFENMEEEILKFVLHPKRVIRNLELYGYDIEDMYL